MDPIQLTHYEPGAIGWVTGLHGSYYAKHWGLDLYFEAKVATELAAFLCRFDSAHDGAWLAKHDGNFVGAIFIDGSNDASEGARLTWFIIDPGYQGQGLGRRLMAEAMAFVAKTGVKRVYLTTFSGLNAARHLYESYGFKLYDEVDGSHLTGNAALVEQKFELILENVVQK